MWKNMVEWGRVQMTVWRMRHIVICIHTHTHTHTHKLRICNNYFFCTATMVTRTPLSVTLYIHCLSCVLNYTEPRRKKRYELKTPKFRFSV